MSYRSGSMPLFEMFEMASTHVVNGAFPKTFEDREVFVYGIPDAVTKQELISMFQRCGSICNFRLSKRSPQLAFIRFTEPQSVRVAVLSWNAFEIRENCRIFVCRSVMNKSLVLLSIPRRLTASNIYRTVSMHTTGLNSVHISPPRDDMGVNSGLAILRFKTRTCANIAKMSLNETLNVVWRRRVHVEWYTPGLIWNDYESAIPTSGEAFSNFPPLGQATDFTRMYNGYGPNLPLLPRGIPTWEAMIPNHPRTYTFHGGAYNGNVTNCSLLPLTIQNRRQGIPNFPLLPEPTDFNGAFRRHGANSPLLPCAIPTAGPATPNFPPMGECTPDFTGASNGNKANSSLLPTGSEAGTSSFFSAWSARRNGRFKLDRRNKSLVQSCAPVEEE